MSLELHFNFIKWKWIIYLYKNKKMGTAVLTKLPKVHKV
jgi:hypothetical protein